MTCVAGHEGRGALREQAICGVLWSVMELAGKQGLQFVIFVVLARLLNPRDFGVIAMISIFIALAQSVIDSGFGQALIQKQDATRTDESSVFYLNVVVGVLMCAALFVAAPWIAAFYRLPELTWVTRAFSFTLVINSFMTVQNALSVKSLRFKRRSVALLVAIAVSGVVGIGAAYCGFGVWALVAQSIAMSLANVLVFWVICPWRPALCFDFNSIKRLAGFGSNMLFSGLLNTLFDKGYLVVIGKLYSVGELGLYQTANQLVSLCAHTWAKVVTQVNFPVMAQIQDDPERMRRAFRQALKMVFLVISPMMVGIAVAAPNIVAVVLGGRWLPCVPFVQILCVIGLLYPIHTLNLGSLIAQGRADLFFRLEVIKKIMVVLVILVSCRYGVLGLLYGQLASSIAALLINTYYTKRFIGLGVFAQLRCVWRIFAMVACMGVVAFAFTFMPQGALVKLVCQVLASALCYGALLLVFRDSEVIAVFASLLERVGKKRVAQE